VNRTRIEWCDYTWNPVTGCLTGCRYCYSRRMTARFHGDFTPTFHADRLDQPLHQGRGARIFVCSMADLFGPWVPRLWIERILQTVRIVPESTFIFLTKWPDRFQAAEVVFPPNCQVGVTLTCGPGERTALRLHQLRDATGGGIRFASFEPLLGPLLPQTAGLFWLHLQWLIIGALTGPGAKEQAPQPEWIQGILDATDQYGIPVFMKDNLRPYWAGEWRREWPRTD